MVFSDEASERITAAFDQSLRKWFDARDDLTSEHLHLSVKNMTKSPEVQRLEAMIAVLKRIWTIRRIYAALEIVAPVVFAIFAILYVQF